MNIKEYEEFVKGFKDYKFNNKKLRKCFLEIVERNGDLSELAVYIISGLCKNIDEQALLLSFASVLLVLFRNVKE